MASDAVNPTIDGVTTTTTDASPSSSADVFSNRTAAQNAMAQSLHVASIKTHVPFLLDKEQSNYNKWRALFLVTLGKFALQDHVNHNPLMDTSDPEWKLLDFTVLSWIYGSISPNIMDTVLKTHDASAQEIWDAIENLFRDNKKARAIQLETEFRSLVQGPQSITDYCQKLKVLADSLNDVDNPISDETLVLQTIRGLNNDFQTMAAIIPMQRPFPTFQECRSMLLLEESRRSNISTVETALLATSATPSNPQESVISPPPPPSPSAPPHQNHNRSRGRGRGRSRGRGGRGWSSWYPSWQYQQPASWPSAPQPTWSAGLLGSGPRPPQPPQAMLTQQWSPNALINTFNGMSLQQPPEGWYMDTGASSHMASNPGSSHQDRDSPM